MSTPFTAAVVQMASVPTDPMATAEQAAARLREAAAKGARLVVFPEALIGSYPKGASFGAPVGMRKPEGRAAFLADEEGYLARYDLTPEQAAAVRARDWAEMVRLGGNLFYILKISAVDPTPIRAIGAAQAGMSLQEFLDTRLGKVTHG